MKINNNIAKDVEAVVTSYNQGKLILEAIYSLCNQTTPPAKIIVLDDGTTDQNSINILNNIKNNSAISVPVTIVRQKNSGVSAARNAGINMTKGPMVLVLDGDDKIEPVYVEKVSYMLRQNLFMVAASSWIRTFGVLDATVCPSGGSITAFLARNNCPATHILRREVWKKCGGYDETMKSGFEDWEFFLSMLESKQGAYIGIVERPLIDYRTIPDSSNIKSMTKRIELMQYIIEKHINIYKENVLDVILNMEDTSMSRLYGWEKEIVNVKNLKQNLSNTSDDFIKRPSYGDGGMAAAVRIQSQ